LLQPLERGGVWGHEHLRVHTLQRQEASHLPVLLGLDHKQQQKMVDILDEDIF